MELGPPDEDFVLRHVRLPTRGQESLQMVFQSNFLKWILQTHQDESLKHFRMMILLGRERMLKRIDGISSASK